MKLKIDLNRPKIISKVTNDRFGRFVANEWKRLINPYTPQKEGHLIGTAKINPFEIHYIEPYSAYVYFGEKYIDPKYGVSGFLGSEGWFSRPGVEKVPSGEQLHYNTKRSPYATDHWDEKAAEGGQLDKLYRTINAGLRSGNF